MVDFYTPPLLQWAVTFNDCLIEHQAPLKMGLKRKYLFCRGKFFLFNAAPVDKGDKNNFTELLPLQLYPFPKNIFRSREL